jgi:transcriptional repressor NrdR
MRCPLCESQEDRVVESRTLAEGDAVYRRRECLACGYRFTSYERIHEKPLLVIKRDGRRQPFDRDKLERGIERALEKRPVSRIQIEAMVNDLENAAARAARDSREIATAAIGEMTLEKLGAMDRVAYIRFASVYRKFTDLDEFIREIRHLGSVQE